MPRPVGRLVTAVAQRPRRFRHVWSLLRVTVPMLPRTDPPSAPIFVVGSPRSGTTMLYKMLSRSPEVRGLRKESHVLWETFHPKGGPNWRSQEILPQEVTERERRFLYWTIARIAGDRRYLDKAPANVLRLPYIANLFPDARFVAIVRDGREVISSLLTGWRSTNRLFPGKELGTTLSIEGYEGTRWKTVLPPGWEAYARGRSLAEVCAFQWSACMEAIRSAREVVPSDRWIELRYEDLLGDPHRWAKWLAERLGLYPDARLLGWEPSASGQVMKAITAPEPDKWRREHPEEIAGILPVIAPLLRRWGYDAEDA